MGRRIVFRPAARADLKAIYHYVAEQAGRQVVGAYIDRIEAACMVLVIFPERGTLRDDLSPGVRIIGFERRISIAFTVDENTVRVVRVLYGGRDYPQEWSGN